MLQVEGTVRDVRFRNEENAYTILTLETEDGPVVVTGEMIRLVPGDEIEVVGEWIYHRKYGEQIAAKKVKRIEPRTVPALEKYLAATLPHVGKKTAREIVSAFGMETLSILREEPKRLLTIPGIGKKKLEDIVSALEEEKENAEVLLALQEFGLGLAAARRAYQLYGEGAAEVIRQNPYRMVEELRGIGFVTADELALKNGVDPASPFRVEAGVLYRLESESDTHGHCFLWRTDLVSTASALLGVETGLVEQAIDTLLVRTKIARRITTSGEAIYPGDLYMCEKNIANTLARMLWTKRAVSAEDVEESIQAVEDEESIVFEENQREAIAAAITCPLLVVTGGPGTGKTTIVRAIVSLCEKAGETVHLCAPTGRAAKRLAESTGHEAMTIHRLLGYRPMEEDRRLSFEYDRENPLIGDVLIVDESSMIDVELMSGLLTALPDEMRVVFVGDVDQLPSVGPGNILRDIIASGKVRTVRLERIFRQDETGNIVANAHRIHRGEFPVLNEEGKDFFLLRTRNQIETRDVVRDLLARRLPNFYGYGFGDIQVLSPMKKGEAGTESLNRVLQEALNPPGTAPQLDIASRIFRVGDRVMQTRNNYKKEGEMEDGSPIQGVYNGDFGMVTALDDEEKTARVTFEDGKKMTYELSELSELLHAYAITVHKSQGSEFPAVVLPLVAGPPMLLTRNLIYTAITRAKELVVLVGDERVLRNMIGNDRIDRRNSALDELLEESLQIYEEVYGGEDR